VGLGLELQGGIRIDRNLKVTQGMLEDIIEAIAGAILYELGYPNLFRWTVLAIGPMVEDLETFLCGLADFTI
jgi:hypothetical protein